VNCSDKIRISPRLSVPPSSMRQAAKPIDSIEAINMLEPQYTYM